MTDVNHDPGPRNTQSASRMAARVSSGHPGSGGSRRTPCTRPRVDATRCCPRTMADGLGVCLVVADDLGLDVERDAGHRQDPPAGVEQPADEVEAVDRVAEQVPQGHDEEVAEGVAGERSLALEPVLQHVAPGVAPLGVVAERGERHPQVARRQDRELLAQPPRGPAVVGDGDHGGDPVGEQLQRGERRRQAVAAAERDDRRVARIPAPGWVVMARSLPSEVAVHEEGVDARRCAVARPAARRWRPTGACRRCSRARG